MLLVGQRRESNDCDKTSYSEQDRCFTRQLPQQTAEGREHAAGDGLATDPEIGDVVAHDICDRFANRSAFAVEPKAGHWPGFNEFDHGAMIEPSRGDAITINPERQVLGCFDFVRVSGTVKTCDESLSGFARTRLGDMDDLSGAQQNI